MDISEYNLYRDSCSLMVIPGDGVNSFGISFVQFVA